MFLVFRWQQGTLPPPRPPKVRAAVPPAPDRIRAALSAIDGLRTRGVSTLADIARALNDDHIPTLSGRGLWHGAQVARAEEKRRA